MLRSLGIFAAILVAVSAIPWDEETPLDAYVHADDGHFSFEIVTSYRYYNACTMYMVNMTSQKWMDETFVDRPYWTHWMGIAVPDAANRTHPEAGFVFISGGNNGDGMPDESEFQNDMICSAALDIGSVGGYINQMPNQPLTFYNDPTLKVRREDSIIAWTWRTFMDDTAPEPDPTVICRFPMTKAAKRALDTIHDVAAIHDPSIDVQKFMVTGPSKRGWTTWSIAATDQRVIAIAPLVFSMLKVNETLMTHYRTLGGAWSFAFGPYYDEDLTRELLEEKAEAAFIHEDMWYYRERLTLPILQIVSTGDEFFLLQDSHQWWDDIPDPKWTLMLENAEHVMFPHYSRIYQTMTSWCLSVLEDIPIPGVTWTRSETPDGGSIDFVVDTPPSVVNAFRAVTLANDTRRDFRLASGNSSIGIEFHPVIWGEENVDLVNTAPNEYRATTTKEEDEWVAFVVKGVWDGPIEGYQMHFTSETQVIPDTFPVEECNDPDSCYGILV